MQKNQKRFARDDELGNNPLDSNVTDATQAALAALDPLSYILELREFDVPYTMRVAIDLDLRIGAWYNVTPEYGTDTCTVEWLRDMLELCEPRTLAFDIECEKSALKFPNAERDRVFMISYMTPNQGYLIINREIVSEDIEDFEYTPKPSYQGPFKVFNVENEEQLLLKFISHTKVSVEYNANWRDIFNR